jgi:hypothetical protein
MKLLSCIVMVMICSAALVRNFLHCNKKKHKQQQAAATLQQLSTLFYLCSLSNRAEAQSFVANHLQAAALSLSLC